jgi:hypothetical protein
MSTDLHILRDLLAGPSTADSLAARIRISTDKTTGLLINLCRDKKVTSEPLGGLTNLQVYRLTLAGKESLNPRP